jgi:glycosyltransferase involved in cell wall biosynthesis
MLLPCDASKSDDGTCGPPQSIGKGWAPVNIVIALVASSTDLSGVSRHAANMARSLLTRHEISAVHLVLAKWQYQSFRLALPQDVRLHIHSVDIGSSNVSRNLWYYSKLPALAAKLGADVVHLAYPVPLQRSAYSCPVVVTLHDLYPYDIPANFGYPKVLFNRLILQQCLNAADAIACVSNSTLRQLDMHSPKIALEKAVTIHNCVEPGPPMAPISPLPEWDEQPFILCVAQHRRNKNLLLALRVFYRLLNEGEIGQMTKLVIVGIQGPETDSINRFIHVAGLTRNVILLQGISDAELQWCYKHCELLIAPSIVEGFGLPVAEAILNDCRIVCSDISAFREVGGNHCHYVQLQPFAEEAFVRAIRFARRNRKANPPADNRFSAELIAKSYLQLYLSLRNHSSSIRNWSNRDALFVRK